jgi:hypothetical protein
MVSLNRPSYGSYCTCTPGQKPCQDVFTYRESVKYNSCSSQQAFLSITLTCPLLVILAEDSP